MNDKSTVSDTLIRFDFIQGETRAMPSQCSMNIASSIGIVIQPYEKVKEYNKYS